MKKEKAKIDSRPPWDDYFMELAQLVATRSTCIRKGRQVGAVLVRDKHILSTGFNGPPSGMAHCEEVGCIRDQLKIPSGTRQEICRAVHAEQNAIIQCALHGVSSKNSTLYVTHQPCAICAKILINAGVKRIVYKEPYPDKFAQEMIAESGIKFERWQQREEE